MSEKISDISAGIRPRVDDKIICYTIRRNYNFHVVNIKRLDGFDDLNFKIRSLMKGDNQQLTKAPDREYIFKILNRLHTENPESVESQHKMMLYLHERKSPVPVPVTNVTGQTYSIEVLSLEDSDEKTGFIVQLLQYIPGITLLEAGNPLDLLPEVGRLTGKMDSALKNFNGIIDMDKENLWELRRLPEISPHIQSHCSGDDSQMGHEIILSYNEHIFPHLAYFQSGIIHGDVNNSNIIVIQKSVESKSQTATKYIISGLIDFIDACSSFYVYELATVMADLMSSCLYNHNPLKVARLIYLGYVTEFPLTELEIKMLKLVICCRLLQSYVLSGMSLESDPENEYINLDRQEYIELCRYLWKMEDREFLNKVVS